MIVVFVKKSSKYHKIKERKVIPKFDLFEQSTSRNQIDIAWCMYVGFYSQIIRTKLDLFSLSHAFPSRHERERERERERINE